ncbi:sialomucin core protein 24-like [Scophthalmus maximus]|uniref:sialomucin core protein 24-like n=1 Tax=Scophthalmus maximus TaxID=52904 RepID=UPI001FA90FE7|nr:sialomucin core protein 24-like [Scophthalmus maximus]XP_047188737.1 sialomucin core protein 24-like [Scophthalmus maximus]
MDTLSAALARYLLAISLALAQTETRDSTITPTSPPGLNFTQTTALLRLSDATVGASVTPNVNENTTPFPSTTWDRETIDDSTVHPTASQSTTVLTPLTESSSPTTATPGAHTPIFTELTIPVSQTTAGYTITPDTTLVTTANSSHTANTTSALVDRTTHGFGLNISEQNITIVFSVALGVFAVALVIVMSHRCKQKVQYLHQPFTNSDDPDAFVADDDTLIISGGLYDGHPIYDNVPTVSDDQSQFRLQFLH